MSVPTNLIPTKITGLPEYTGGSQAGFFPYVLDGTTYKVQFSNVASVGEVPPSRTLTAGTGLVGGGDLSANRVFAIANGGVGASQLDTTGVVAGVYGNGSNVPTVTVDANGRVTSVTTSPVVATGYVPEGRLIIAGTGLIGGGSLANNVTLSVNLASATPQALGTATAGVSTAAAREDHVHPAVDLSDTNETQGALPLGRGGTGDALSPVAGAVVYSTGTKFALTNPGISGQVLTSTGTDEPVWTTLTGTGTVTSVNASGGTTGMTFTGGPITTVGTLTLGGTLSPDNGGTGLTATPTNGQLPIGNGTGYALSTLTAGTAVSITNGVGSITIDNTAPDRIVSLTGAGTTSISGTYPNFTITSNDQFDGTVTSVAASGGSTGLTFSGSPITSAGTLTLGGTLSATSGGTGLSAAPANGQLAIGNGTGYSLSTITAGSGVSVTNAAGSITIDNTAPDQIVSLTAGTAISVTGTYPSFTVTNTAPDQIVSLTGAGTTSISGTYPNFTITSNDQFIGTVTSVAASGGATGLTFSGSPITSAGTLTLSGTLAVASGGTGATNAGAARTALGAAASGANTDITSIALTSGTIQNAPTSGTDIVNKAYADSIASGINFHQAVRLATVAALPAYTYNNGSSGVGATITANANGALSIDGVAVVAGNRVLIKNEVGAAQAYNGVYVVTQTGSGSTPFILTRATDFDSAGSGVDQIDAGDFFLVTAGATLSNTSWVQQTPLPITVGTTPIIFSQFGAPVLYTAGTGLTLAGTVFSITNTGVSANTYGSASSVPVIAVNAQGQITSASSTSISIAASQITSGAVAVGTGGTGLTATPTNGQLLIGNGAGYSLSTLTAGTGVSVTNGSGSVTVTNTAPDQIVSLTGAGSTVVTGTYPNFTITSTAGTGTVTSVAASGGTTGLTFSGSPITTSGTLTLGGTLAVANGGTGATSLSSGFLLRGNGTSPVSASVIFDNGTNVGIGTSSPATLLDVNGVTTFRGSTNQTSGAHFTSNGEGLWMNGFASYGAGITSDAAGTAVRLWTSGSERVRITSAGNVGVGISTVTPIFGTTVKIYNAGSGGTLEVGGATINARFFGSEGAGIAGVGTTTNTAFNFITNDTERMRLTSGGNLLVGTTVNYSRLTVSNGNSTRSGITISDANTASLMMFAGAGSNAVIAIDTNNLVFQTGATAGQDNGTERLTINSSGNVTANVDFRAPIYYDSNNTAFYLDPAGTSVLNGIGAGTVSATNFTAANAFYVNGFAYYLNSTNGGWYANARIQSETDMRAPIFYDSNNTAFYLDPAGTSVLGTVRASNIQFSNGNTAITLDNSSYQLLRDPTGNITLFLGGADPNNYYDNSGHFFRNRGGTAVMAQITGSGVFAPIFYDLNNTGFYVDPASTSVMADAVIGGRTMSTAMFYAGFTLDANTMPTNSTGFTYAVNAPFLGPIARFSTGGGYDLWLNAPYVGGNGLSFRTRDGDLATLNAWQSVAVYNSNRSSGDLYATIYYDNNNTAFYLDPNGTSILNVVTVSANGASTGGGVAFGGTANAQFIRGRNSDGASATVSNLQLQSWFGIGFGPSISGQTVPIGENAAWIDVRQGDLTARRLLIAGQDCRAPIFYDSNNTAYFLDASGNSRFSSFDVDTTSRFFGGGSSSAGLAFENQGTFARLAFYDLDFWDWNVGGSIFRLDNFASSSTSFRAPIFFDSNNTAYYVDPTGGTSLRTTGDWRSDSSAWTGEFNGKIQYHANNWYFQAASSWEFRRSDTANAFFVNQSGECTARGDYRAPIYYDSNDTFFYLNLNGYSQVNGFGSVNASSGVGLNIMGNPSNGAMMAFHRSAAFAINMGLDTDNVFRMGGWSAAANRLQMDMNGNLTMAGNVTAYSDIRLKKDIETIDGALDLVSKMRGVRYTRIDTENRNVGVIAQEMLEVLPEVVQQGVGDDDTLSVAYGNLVGVLIEAVKELTARVAELEGK